MRMREEEDRQTKGGLVSQEELEEGAREEDGFELQGWYSGILTLRMPSFRDYALPLYLRQSMIQLQLTHLET